MHNERTRVNRSQAVAREIWETWGKNPSQCEQPSAGMSAHNLHHWRYSKLDWIRPWLTLSRFGATPALNRLLGELTTLPMPAVLILYSMGLKIRELMRCPVPLSQNDILLTMVSEIISKQQYRVYSLHYCLTIPLNQILVQLINKIKTLSMAGIIWDINSIRTMTHSWEKKRT